MNSLQEQLLHSRILIVDDKPENVALLQMMLKIAGYDNVESTTDSIEVLERCRNNNYDLVLLDIRMPHLDGFHVMEQLSAFIDNDYLPILVLTAQNDMQTRLKALQSGAKDFVTKPFDHTEVLNRISNLLEVRLLYKERNDAAILLEQKVNERTRELHDTRLMIIQRLGRAAEYRDNETGMHVIRMSKFSHKLALAAGLGESRAELVLNASLMHDVGKIGIPDRILLKPGKLDKDEFDVMKTHCQIGADIIGVHDLELMKIARSISLTHHEKWDGSGYPNGLKGDAIPIEGRIIAVCDVFDALTSVRPYKEAWPIDKAMSLINSESGAHFDPHFVQLFNQILPDVIAIKYKFSETSDSKGLVDDFSKKSSVRIIFKDEYLLGNLAIDNEHKKLFEIINSVHDAVIDGDIALCERLFTLFESKSIEHFHTEERMLAESKYPALKERCDYHRKLLDHAKSASEKCRDMKDKDNLLTCFDDMVQLFMDDILQGDLEFKSHLLETGFATKPNH